MERDSSVNCQSCSIVNCQNLRVFSVLCVGGISDEPVKAWESRIKLFWETRYLKDMDRIDGEPMKFAWKNFSGFTQKSLNYPGVGSLSDKPVEAWKRQDQTVFGNTISQRFCQQL